MAINTSITNPNLYAAATETTPEWTVTPGMVAKVIDATGGQTINIAAGGKIDVSGVLGANTFVFEGLNANDVTVQRSGMEVSILVKGEKVASIPASTTAQTLKIGGQDYNLVFSTADEQVVLGSVVVTTTAKPLVETVSFTLDTETGGSGSGTYNVYTFGGNATGNITTSIDQDNVVTFTRGGVVADTTIDLDTWASSSNHIRLTGETLVMTPALANAFNLAGRKTTIDGRTVIYTTFSGDGTVLIDGATIDADTNLMSIGFSLTVAFANGADATTEVTVTDNATLVIWSLHAEDRKSVV